MGTAAGASVSGRQWASLVLLAALYAGLNAVKPLTIDDGAYFYYARQIAQHPLDPYGFSFLWYVIPWRANEILAPPVLPYWWGATLHLSDAPWVWKAALLPWCLLLIVALYGLFRRFASELALPLTWFTILSPALLPSLNLMLDIPALALALGAVALFLRACDRSSFGLAALAGLMAGVAMETKYTGALAPGVMLLAAAVRGRWLLWPVAAFVAGQTFATWELLTALLYGKSHFFMAFDDGSSLLDKIGNLPALFSLLGSVGAAGILLGLTALGTERPRLLGAAISLVFGYVLILFLDVQFTGSVSARIFGNQAAISLYGQHAEIVFDAFAVLGGIVLVAIIWRLWTTPADGTEEAKASRRDTLFLVLWLGLEIVGFFPLTSFPAVRRVLGIGIVVTLLLGRLAARICRTPERRPLLKVVWGIGIALGLAHAGLDWYEAYVHKQAAETARQFILERGGGRTWFVGHWGFQFDAERRGMEPVLLDYNWHRSDLPTGDGLKPVEVPLPPPSRLRVGDWLVVPSPRLNQQKMRLDEGQLREEITFVFDDPVPLRTIQNFYGGQAALEHHEGPRLEVTIYRVLQDFTPVYAEGD